MTIRTRSAYSGVLLLRDEMLRTSTVVPMSPKAFAAFAAEATRNQGPQAGKALQAAYDKAREKLGRDPTLEHVKSELQAAEDWLDEKADLNRDGFVDDSEAKRGGRTAVELYGFASTLHPAAQRAPAISATAAQADKAAGLLKEVIARAVQVRGNGSFNDALVKAAKELGVPAAGELLVKWSGVDGSGILAADSFITKFSADLSKQVDAMRAGIASVDGKPIVDFDNPTAPAVKQRDGVTTDLEFERSNGVQGLDLLAFAATL